MSAGRRKSYRGYLWKARKTTCFWCGRRLAVHEITADHVVPLSAGGYDKRKNVVSSCARCNSAKGSLPASEFVRSPRFADPDSSLNRIRRDHPRQFDLARAHGVVPLEVRNARP